MRFLFGLVHQQLCDWLEPRPSAIVGIDALRS